MSHFRQINRPAGDSDSFMSAAEIAKLARGNNNIQQLTPDPTWVPVAQRTPALSGDYLVLLRGEKHRLMSFDTRANKFTPRNMNQVVTHWMSLPPVPG